MYEIFMRSRWIIAAFFALTVGSIVTWASNRPADSASVEIADAPRVEGADYAADDDAAAAPGPARTTSAEDQLIDKTVGEDVRPEEEKQAEAAALAAIAASQRLPPPADGADEGAPAE